MVFLCIFLKKKRGKTPYAKARAKFRRLQSDAAVTRGEVEKNEAWIAELKKMKAAAVAKVPEHRRAFVVETMAARRMRAPVEDYYSRDSWQTQAPNPSSYQTKSTFFNFTFNKFMNFVNF